MTVTNISTEVSNQTAVQNGTESVSGITEVSTNGFSKSSVNTNKFNSTRGFNPHGGALQS